jgi:hypothetical protein
MEPNHGKRKRNTIVLIQSDAKCFLNDTRGDAVVEATILFPIMILIFAALVLLSIHLPTRAALQQATQYAATVIATEISDTWLFFDESEMNYDYTKSKEQSENVYSNLFKQIDKNDVSNKGETIVTKSEGKRISSKAGKLSVESYIVNNIIYKEVVVTATREFPMPIDLSFVGFPDTIFVTVSSTAVVLNGNELVLNIDIMSGFAEYISEKFGLNDVFGTISSYGSKVTELLGW